MNCRRTKRQLLEHLEGRLPVRLAEEIDLHLAACPACRDTATRLRQGKAILLTLGRRPAPDGLKDAIWERVAAEQGQGAARQGWVGAGLALGYRRWSVAGTALVVAVLVFLGVRWVLRAPGGSLEGPPMGGQTARMVGEGNEMDEFANFCLEQHSQFVSQRALWDEGSLGIVQQVRPSVRHRVMRSVARPRQPFQASSKGDVKTVPDVPGQTVQWWWTEGGG